MTMFSRHICFSDGKVLTWVLFDFNKILWMVVAWNINWISECIWWFRSDSRCQPQKSWTLIMKIYLLPFFFSLNLMVHDRVHHYPFEILLEMKLQLGAVVEVPLQYKAQHIVAFTEAFPHLVRNPVDEHQVVLKLYVSFIFRSFLLVYPNIFVFVGYAWLLNE